MPDTNQGFSLRDSLGHMLHRAQQVAADLFQQGLGDSTLTLRQFAVLAAAHERPNSTQTDLVNVTGIDRSTLADMIARMQERRLIERKSAPNDKRAKIVSLTATGRKAFEMARPHAEQADAMILERVPLKRREAFVAGLKTLTESAAVDGDAPGTDDEREAPRRKAEAQPARRSAREDGGGAKAAKRGKKAAGVKGKAARA